MWKFFQWTSRFRVYAGGIACIAVLLLLATQSGSYRACYSDAEAYYGDYEKTDPAQDPITLFRCEGIAIGQNGEFITALATVALFFSTLLLWFATRDSVKIATRALTDLERPYIFIWGIQYVPHIPHFSGKPTISYKVTNSGKMASIVENIQIAIGEISNEVYPPLVVIGDHGLLQSPILASGVEYPDDGHEVPASLLKFDPPARWPKDGVIFRVVITYRGPITDGHETSQCWRYRAKDPRGFVEMRDPLYTYVR